MQSVRTQKILNKRLLHVIDKAKKELWISESTHQELLEYIKPLVNITEIQRRVETLDYPEINLTEKSN